MSGRFEIEDLVTQDASRVLYRARDRDSDALVALRRLLPGGHAGSGLSDEDAQAFEESMRLLEEAEAPGLRRVVGWGIDPIDRVPFHACEWIEGELLEEVLGRGVLSVEAGRMLVEQALEAQVALDETGGGWRLATRASSVIVAGGDQEFWFSFWVEAFPGPVAESVVDGLADLVERAMGWQGRVPAAGAGDGLAAWLRGVRHDHPAAVDALAMLRRKSGAAAEPAVVRPERPAIPGVPGVAAGHQLTGSAASLSWTVPRHRSRIGVWLGAACLAVVLFGVGAWMIRRSQRPAGADGEGSGLVVRPAGQGGNARAAEVSARAEELMRMAESGNFDALSETFTPEDGPRLRAMLGQEVMIEGLLAGVRDSSSGQTRYLEFSSDRGVDDICGRYWARDGDGVSMGELKPLEGRRVRIKGEVQIESGTGRVVVHLERREQLEDLGPGTGGAIEAEPVDR